MSAKKILNARSLALRVLREVQAGRIFASAALDAVLSRYPLNLADRGLCTQLVYGVLRQKACLERVVSEYVSAAKTPSGLRSLLLLAAYQALCLDKVPDHAVVNESVELAKDLFGVPPSRMVNAVLRKILLERVRHVERLADPAGAFPSWMSERWRRRYAAEALHSLINYFQETPPHCLRVHRGKMDPELLLRRLREAGCEAMRVEETPLLIVSNLNRETLAPLLERGEVSVQDLHSYRVAEAVVAKPGEQILDACAGHGGKSAAILEGSSGLQLSVHEPNKVRLSELKENFRRLGLEEPKILASAETAARAGLQFDWILVDAPCSGMGTLGRKPEIRWRLKPQDLPRLAVQQRKILEEWWPSLKVGGRLVYAVCSLEPEEGSEQIRGFADNHPDAEILSTREWLPGISPGDGFFVASLRRRA